ncbi:MFS transporter [Enemella dayhoffiae]|uniref:MFS transporter n=1 Tax=Enemella dayhoffiae TaxID=2016507 RepID=A0A255GX34_9ACTN|nr:MFS transporter [Enemella dayhoffiae]OYO18144.1 MFS transporter [Enemella dayhoffiae]
MSTRRARLIWAVAVVAYAIAVLHRTSLGVAAPQAVHHFGIHAGVLSIFVVLQVAVYTASQIPVGLALDRTGPRTMITIGAVLMATGQLVMALSGSLPIAFAARVLVGAGDAATFVSAVRLLPSWFPAGRIPLLTQLTGALGQTGQILSAVPLVWLLGNLGWRTGFLACASAGLFAAVSCWILLRDSPQGRVRRTDTGPESFLRQLQAVVTQPGTWLGFFSHYTTCFAPMTFALMWGFPFLVQGESRSPAVAGGLLTVFVIGSIVTGPVVGQLTRAHPLRRSNLVLAASMAGLVPWVLVLLWPGPAPTWLLLILVIGLSIGGPGSAIGFDFARTANDRGRLGTATAVVIMGGFLGALVAVLLIGAVLDGLNPGGGYGLHDYRWAMAAQVPMYVIGLVGIYSSRHRTRAQMAAEGLFVPTWAEALRREYRRLRR